MEITLIVFLGVVVFLIWRSSQDAMAQLRSEIETLEREIGSLRSKLAELLKLQTASTPISVPTAVKDVPAKQPEMAPRPTPQPQEPRPVPPPPPVVHHAPPPAIAAFKPATPIQTTPPVIAIHPPAIPPPPPQPAPLPIQPAAPPRPPVAPAAFTPTPSPAETKAATREAVFSLEQKLGTNWLNKSGIALVVIGIGSFLALKFPALGPGGKVISGFAVSLALLAGGVWLERKPTYRLFARGGIGGGWALAFFTTYAMHHLSAARVLDSLVADLVLMLLVAAGMVGHSLRYRSQTVTGLAFLLGFGTLLMSHLEGTDDTVVFSLTASVVLALALVVVTTLRHWAWLELTGLIAVYASHFVWLTRVLPENHAAFTEFWPSTVLILMYWLIFRLAYVLRTPLDQKEENISSLSAVLNSIGVLGLLKYQSAHPEWAFWALMTLGAIEMALAFRVRSRRRQAFVVLSTIATVLLISAVPFRFHGVSWPVLWLLQAQVLALCGLRLSEPVFRRLGLLAGLVTGGVLAFHDAVPLLLFRLDYPDPKTHWSLTVGLSLAAILYWIHAEVYPRRWPQIAEDDLETFALRITSWLGVAAAAAALWVALPDLWVPVGWLVLVLVLAFAAHRFGAARLAFEADVLALGAGAVLLIHHGLPLFFFRLDYPDPDHHLTQTVVFGLAAMAYWIRAEVYPRALRRLDSDSASGLPEWLAFVLPVLSWLGAGAACAALWTVLPDLWVPVGWLALVLVLAFTAQRFAATALSLEADALAFLSAGVLAIHHVLPLALLRLDYPDPSHHSMETTILALAAVAYWVRAEVYPRLALRPSSSFDLTAWQSLTIPATSWLGLGAAAAALWVALPASRVVVGWLALVVVLGLASDWLKSQILALQGDLLAVASLVGLCFWDLGTQGWWDHRAPLIASVALLYAGMRRKTVPAGAGKYVAPAYSWAATLLLSFAAADISSAVALTPIWAALGVALFEIGRLTRKGFLRWQGYLLVSMAFARYLFINLLDTFGFSSRLRQPALFVGGISLTNSLLLEVLVLAAAGYWLFERTRNRERCTRREYIVGLLADGLGTLSIALWFAYRFPSTWVPVPGGETWVTAIWAAMATVLLALAWLMRRRTFLVQSIALVVVAVARGLFFDLFADSPADFWYGPLFHLGVTALILLAALPFAFRLRREDVFGAPTFTLPSGLTALLRHSEQLFFFAAFGFEVFTFAVKLSSGHITIGWSLLGLATFLFALIVGERSYRLAGLGLLLVSVAKILVMDVWQLPLADRYITFIVLGAALLAVNFLYIRFAAAIRKFL